MLRTALASLFACGLLASATAARAQPPEGMPMAPEGHGRLGIQIEPMTPELRQHMKAPSEAGLLVVRVEADSPAAAAGVKVGDVVTRVGGDAVDSPHDLIARVAHAPEGEKLALELVRDGKTRKLEVTPKGAPFTGFHHGMEGLEHRLDDIERRLQELERRLPPEKPA